MVLGAMPVACATAAPPISLLICHAQRKRFHRPAAVSTPWLSPWRFHDASTAGFSGVILESKKPLIHE
jgi:hypothetical protein